MIHSDALQVRRDEFVVYLDARLREGKDFEATIKFSSRQVEASKKFVYRFTLDNPTVKKEDDT